MIRFALAFLGLLFVLAPVDARAPEDAADYRLTAYSAPRNAHSRHQAQARHNAGGLVGVPTSCLPSHLKVELAEVRRIAGRAVVVSAHRPGATFSQGGATYRSAHADCRAMDVVVPESKRGEVLSYLNSHQLGCVITHCKGCGPIPEHVHVDDMLNYCPKGSLSPVDRWTGKKIKPWVVAARPPKPRDASGNPTPALGSPADNSQAPKERIKINSNPPQNRGVMYGFQGIRGIFDEAAFKEFARRKGWTPFVIAAWQSETAVAEFRREVRERGGGAYAFYGYSQGAFTADLAVAGGAKPLEVFTIGAYRTFDMAAIRRLPAGTWHNYWDASSGAGAAATPAGGGFALKDGHYSIQAELNRRLAFAEPPRPVPLPRERPSTTPALSALEIAEIEAGSKTTGFVRTGPFMVPSAAVAALPPIRPEDAKAIFSRNSDDEYLWHVYTRTARKIDAAGDFTWKDPKAAKMAKMSLPQYVIGGMSARLKKGLAAAGREMDRLGIRWAILSGYRDDYRQSIAEGIKAATGYSLHGGSKRTCGYGCGMAADLCDVSNDDCEKVAGWIARFGRKYGLVRPFPGFDAFHIQLADTSSPGPSLRRHATHARGRMASR